MHTMEYYAALKEVNSTICINLNEPWGYYAKWNNHRKKNNAWFYWHEVSKIVKFTKSKSGMMVAKGGVRGGRNGESNQWA